MGEPENQDSGEKKRAAVYIDGFNLYHPINDMGEPFLKWISLWNLSEMFCHPIGANLVKVVYCTAVADHMPEKRDRHNTYIGTQRAAGVTVIKGHHVFDEQNNKFTEKQSDINVALSLILDGLDDIYDVAFLLSADSDQAATAKIFSERLDKKKIAHWGCAPREKSSSKGNPLHEGAFFAHQGTYRTMRNASVCEWQNWPYKKARAI